MEDAFAQQKWRNALDIFVFTHLLVAEYIAWSNDMAWFSSHYYFLTQWQTGANQADLVKKIYITKTISCIAVC